MRVSYFLSVIITLALLQLIGFNSAISQTLSDTVQKTLKPYSSYGIAWIPAKAPNVYGVAIGLIGSETVCNLDYTRHSHGLNVQLVGQGIFQPFYIKSLKNLYALPDSVQKKLKASFMRSFHNGLVLSTFGTMTHKTNGIAISPWMSFGGKLNGIAFNMLWNLYYDMNGASIGLVNHALNVKGVQIGLLNRTKKLKGIQIGLWNKNEKRSFPFINWDF